LGLRIGVPLANLRAEKRLGSFRRFAGSQVRSFIGSQVQAYGFLPDGRRADPDPEAAIAAKAMRTRPKRLVRRPGNGKINNDVRAGAAAGRLIPNRFQFDLESISI
jgi:hypothetical protein